jgi:hypothetical protein
MISLGCSAQFGPKDTYLDIDNRPLEPAPSTSKPPDDDESHSKSC